MISLSKLAKLVLSFVWIQKRCPMVSVKRSPTDLGEEWVEYQTRLGRYDVAVREHVQELIQHDQHRTKKIAALQALVDDAYRSGVCDRSLDEIWEVAQGC